MISKWVVAVALVWMTSAQAVEITGQVVTVSDGDSFALRATDGTRHRVRIDGIDAPERTQPYSQVSRKNLSTMISGQIVTVTSTKTDRFGRRVGIVRTSHVEDIGLAQLTAGLAWHFKRYEKEMAPETRARYAAAEAVAKAASRGLWRDPEPRAPWEFRARNAIPESPLP